MSPHRYTPAIPPAPRPERHQRAEPFTIALLFFTFAGAGALSLVWDEPAIAKPVHSPNVVVFPLEAVDGQRLAEIRAEAFGAGLAEGLAQGVCNTAATLSHPVAQR
jgi:hypothetical protein